MSTYNLPSEPEWIVKSRKAAYCARRRLNGADLTCPGRKMPSMQGAADLRQ